MSNRVEPIRSKRKISNIKNMLRGSGKVRDYILFVLGINFGLRVGDLLEIKISDVYDINSEVKESFEIVENKTGKRNFININNESVKALNYLKDKERNILKNRDNFIIYNTKNKYKSISRVQAYKLVKKWCNNVGLSEISIGTHTLRKSWGYHAHKEGIPIEVIQEKYKHNSTSTTRHYLGIERKDVNEAYDKVNL